MMDHLKSKSGRPPIFHSILYETPGDRGSPDGEPEFFLDLNCDQMVTTIIADKVEYNLAHYFYDCLTRVGAIEYRHEVMRDLESSSLYEQIARFAEKMREMRDQRQLAKKLRIMEQKQAWQLQAATTYCSAVRTLAAGLNTASLKSRGFASFRDYLVNYTRSDFFTTLDRETHKLANDIADIEYCVLARGTSFTVQRYAGEADYSFEVEQTFDKFKQGAAKDYRVKFPSSNDMNHIEAKILEFVAKLFPDVFRTLDDYCGRLVEFADETIMTFDREIQFYVAYLEYIATLRPSQLPFCYPRLSERTDDIFAHECFDVVLAHKLAAHNATVVCNDFSFTGRERIIVVSGPNQGGKTTFARTIGQIHYLASVGCPVPAREAQLQLFDQLFTQFEKEERVENLRGKLEDDLVRMRAIVFRATPRSMIVLNEVFNSTTIQDEVLLSNKIMEQIIHIGALCVWVTFVDELASFGPQTVSMVSAVVPENPALRTFKVVRRPADGLAYAMAIAQKYRLTYAAICMRIDP
jgi:DNA mismatch repair protein MutS